MPEGNGKTNGGLIDTKISIGQIGIILSIVVSGLTFYFTGQTNVGERINKLENDLNTKINKVESDASSRLQASVSPLAERVGKNETRIAVIEQHQVQEDANITDARTTINSFIVDVRQQLSRIIEQVSDFRVTIQSRDGQGTNIRTR